LRQGEAERARGFEIDDQFELGRLIDRDIPRPDAPEDLVHIVGNLLGSFGGIGPICESAPKRDPTSDRPQLLDTLK
jgi:hypothetical protein